jgi:GT2 family glycosyltransferase
MDIVFVILHYMVEEETYRCVEYIRDRIDTKDYHIVIVDNASSNGSGMLVEKKYSDSLDVSVLLNQKNVGYSRGNNIGFRYAKKKWNPRYIVFVNNDVYLLEKQLLKKLDEEYNKSKFAVLGPLVMSGDGRCNINPVRLSPMTRSQVENEIKTYKRKKFLYDFHLMGLRNVIIYIKNMRCKTWKNNKDYLHRVENVQLHGCFLVFSHEYITRFDGLDERTFLFREEAILYKHMMDNKLKTVYEPEIIVFHKEDASIKAITHNDRKKAMFEIENHLNSLNVLLSLYKK